MKPLILTSISPPGRLLSVAAVAALAAGAVMAPSDAVAAEEGRWLIRGGVTQVAPKSDNGNLSAGAISVDDRIGPSVNVAYFINPNWAIDVLGALPFKHDFSLNGAAAGSTKHLPPTVTLQYHFMPRAQVQPYVGAGLNVTLFMGEELDSGNDLELDPSFGLSAQVGLDVPINPRWRVGLDARYIDIDTDASVDGQGIGTIKIDPLVYSLNLGYRF